MTLNMVINALKELAGNIKPVLIAEKAGSVSANTNIFDDFSVPDSGYIIVQIGSDTAGYPIVVINGQSYALNQQNNLTTNSIYEFWMVVTSEDTLNVQFSADANVLIRVFYVGGGV